MEGETGRLVKNQDFCGTTKIRTQFYRDLHCSLKSAEAAALCKPHPVVFTLQFALFSQLCSRAWLTINEAELNPDISPRLHLLSFLLTSHNSTHNFMCETYISNFISRVHYLARQKIINQYFEQFLLRL